MELPPFPDAGEPCVTTTPYVLVAVCVNGLRVLQWAFASEIINELPPAPMELRSGGQCAKVKLLETAERCQWSPDQVAKSLGLK